MLSKKDKESIKQFNICYDNLGFFSEIRAIIDRLVAENEKLHKQMYSSQPYYYEEWQKLQSRLDDIEKAALALSNECIKSVEYSDWPELQDKVKALDLAIRRKK